MTARVVRLVRHGRAAAGWDQDPDPGLDAVGHDQATLVAGRLAEEGVGAIVSSTLARCRQTAQPLADRTGREVRIDAAVAEIPSPAGLRLDQRDDWLRAAMTGEWADLGGAHVEYRDRVVAAVSAMDDDTVVFTHFVAINAVIGACTGTDAVVVYRPDHCSVTRIALDAGSPRLLDGGDEADTEVR